MDKSARITLIILGVILLLVAGFLVFQQQKNSPTVANISNPNVPASIVFKNHDEEEVRLDQYADKILIVTSWASWCPSCLKELTALNQLQAAYTDEIAVVAVNRAEPPTQISYYLESIPELPYIDFLRDPDDSFFAHTDGYTIPETIVYHPDGTLVAHKRGVTLIEDMKKIVERIQEEE